MAILMLQGNNNHPPRGKLNYPRQKIPGYVPSAVDNTLYGPVLLCFSIFSFGKISSLTSQS